MIKKVKPFNKTAAPMWVRTEVVVDKQGKRKQTQEWASTKEELSENTKDN